MKMKNVIAGFLAACMIFSSFSTCFYSSEISDASIAPVKNTEALAETTEVQETENESSALIDVEAELSTEVSETNESTEENSTEIEISTESSETTESTIEASTEEATESNTSVVNVDEEKVEAQASASPTPAPEETTTSEETKELHLSTVVSEENMYATLLDEEQRIVSTTNPSKHMDAFYENGGTVDLGQDLCLLFEMKEIASYTGDATGILEGIKYYMDLSDSLIPTASEGEKSFVNTNEPIEFFHYGEVKAKGGIYSTDDSWKLEMEFSDVEDQTDVSGSFQFNVKVNETLEKGTQYDVIYYPAGTISFNTTPEEEVIEPSVYDYTLEMVGGFDEQYRGRADTDKFFENKVFFKTSFGNPNLYDIPDKIIDIDFKDQGIALIYNKNAEDIYTLPIKAEVTYEDGTTVELSVNKRENIYTFSDSSNYINEADETSYPYLSINLSETNGYTNILDSYNNTFMIDALKVQIGGIIGGETKPLNEEIIKKKIKNIDIKIQTEYFDYKTRGSLDVASNIEGLKALNSEEELSSSVKITRGSWPFVGLELNETQKDIGPNSNGYPKTIDTNITIDCVGRDVLYYNFDFDATNSMFGPEAPSNPNAYYYINRASFENGYFKAATNTSLVYDYHNDNYGSFNKFRIKNAANSSYIWDYDWTSCKQKEDFIQFLNDDILFYHQLKEFLGKKSYEELEKDASSLRLFRSTYKNNGRYVYVLLDKESVKKATDRAFPVTTNTSFKNAFTYYDKEGGNLPYIWKIHIFNAYDSKLEIGFDQSLRTLSTGNNQSPNGMGKVDFVSFYQMHDDGREELLNRKGCSSTLRERNIAEQTPTWITDDIIRWDVSIDTSYLDQIAKGEYGWTPSYGDGWYGHQSVGGNMKIYVSLSPKLKTLGAQGFRYNDETYFFDWLYLYNYETNKYDSILGAFKNRVYDSSNNIKHNNENTTLNTAQRRPYGRFEDFYTIGTNNVSRALPENKRLRFCYFTKVSENTKASDDLYSTLEIKIPVGGYNVKQYQIDLCTNKEYTKIPATSKGMSFTRGSISNTDFEKTEFYYNTQNMLINWDNDYTTDFNIYKKNHYLFNGSVTVKDNMAKSYCKDKNGNVIDISPAEFVKLKMVNPSIKYSYLAGDENSQNYSYGSSASVNFSDIQPESVENKTCDYDANRHSYYMRNLYDSFDMQLKTTEFVLNYGKSMNEGFSLDVSNIKNAFWLDNSYKLEFDNKAFFEELQKKGYPIDEDYDICLVNEASTNIGDKFGIQPTTQTVNFKAAAALAVNKSVKEAKDKQRYEHDYSVESKVGYSPVPYITMEDFISSYEDAGSRETAEDGTFTAENRYTLSDNPEAVKLLGESFSVDGLKITAYEYKGSAGEPSPVTVYENGGFAEGWTGEFTEGSEENLYSVTIRKADGSNIYAGTKFVVTYKGILDIDGSGFRESEYYSGDELFINNMVKAVTPYSVEGDIEPVFGSGNDGYESYIDTENNLLVCYGGAGAEYLAVKELSKEILSQNGNTSEWFISEWTGTKGKGLSDITLIDNFYYVIDNIYNTREDLTEEEQKALVDKLQYILMKHSSFKDVEIYEQKDSSQPFDSTIRENILTVVEGTIDSSSEKEIDGRHVSITYTPEAIYEKDGEVTIQNKTINVSVDGIDYDQYIGMHYFIDIDWAEFYKEAMAEGLIDENMHATGTNNPVSFICKNVVEDEDGTRIEEGGSKIELKSSSLEKSVSSVNAAEGTAVWKLSGFTGEQDASSVTFEDRIETTEKAKAATSIKNVKVTASGKKIYDGSLENPYTEGYEGNVEVSVNNEELSISVVVKNAENKILGKNTAVEVTYETCLDHEKFIEAGITNDNSYTLNNHASMRIGNTVLEDNENASFRPDYPITASKKFNGNESGSNISSWEIKASTGKADRNNFTISDTFTAGGLEEYCSYENLRVIVEDAEGSHEYSVDSLADGMSIEVNESSFNVVMANIKKETDVTVIYDIVFDKDRYMEDSGESSRYVKIMNTTNVSSEDGYSKNASAEGYVYVESVIEKSGTRNGKSSSGNEIFRWFIDVDLLAEYSKEQITAADSIEITDKLDSALSYMEGSLKVYPITSSASGQTVSRTPLNAEAYTAEVVNNEVHITLNKPVETTAFEIVLDTECHATLNWINNKVALDINGKKHEDTSEDIDDIFSVDENGVIYSANVPMFTPYAFKYMDGSLLTGTDRIFSFMAQEVDENGNVIEGGYLSESNNDEDGKITFDTIKYDRSTVGVHYYKFTETGTVKKDAKDYVLDENTFIVKVSVEKTKHGYNVYNEVIDSVDAIFNNTTVTKREIPVSKVWNDTDDTLVRPDAVTVRLFADGKDTGKTIDLLEENGYNGIFKDIDIYDKDDNVIEYSIKEETDNYVYTISGNMIDGFTVTNSITRVKFDKKDAFGNKLPDAVMLLLDEAGNEIKRWNSGEEVEVIGLSKNKEYTLREFLAPEAFEKAEDITFTINDSGKVSVGGVIAENNLIVMTDDYLKGSVIVTKTGDVLNDLGFIETVKGYIIHGFEWITGKLSDVEFEIYAAEDIVLNGTKVYEKDALVDTIKTDASGTAKKDELPCGKYYLKETKTKDGYVLDGEAKFFEIKDAGGTTVAEAVSVNNDRQKVDISIIKTDAETKEGLEGAIFGLYAEGGFFSKDDLIAVCVTGEDGKASFGENVPFGKYYVKELLAPEGYILSEEKHDVDLNSEADIVLNVVNAAKKARIIKLDEHEKALSGAELKLVDSLGNTVDTWISGESYHEIKGLQDGTYTLIETKTPNGYAIASPINFTVSGDKEIYEISMTDYITKLEITKSDITDSKPVIGAVLVIKDKDGKEVAKWTTTEKPHYIEAIPTGEYTLTEITAPDGYATAETVSFTVKDTGEIQKVEMKDDVTKLEITKSDITDSKPVIGAVLVIKDKDGKEIAKWTTTEKPHYIEKIPVGEYTLTEITAPEGYLTAETVSFTVKDTGEIQKVNMKDDFTKVQITKSDITDGKPVIGAVLVIKDAKGKEVAKWTTTDKPYYIEKLPAGKYTLTELTAPEGYLMAETVNFTVKETGEIQKVNMIDDVTKAKIKKIDKDSRKPVSGATLQILKDGKVVKEWITDGKEKLITKLPEGKYTLREKKAPEGYELAEDIEFEITDSKDGVVVVMEDKVKPKTSTETIKPTSSPKPVEEVVVKETPEKQQEIIKTGVNDVNNPKGYLFIIAAAVCLAGIFLVIKKKKK